VIAPKPSIFAADPEFKLGALQDIVVVDWVAIPTRPRVQAFDKAIRDAAKTHEKVTVIVRVRAPMKIPPQEIRDQLTGVIRDSEPHTTGWAVALEGDGFWAAAHRTFSASMHMLSGSKTKMRIFKDVDLAASWAADLCKHSAPEIARIVELVCRSSAVSPPIPQSA
jgi:hypothetical protein